MVSHSTNDQSTDGFVHVIILHVRFRLLPGLIVKFEQRIAGFSVKINENSITDKLLEF